MKRIALTISTFQNLFRYISPWMSWKFRWEEIVPGMCVCNVDRHDLTRCSLIRLFLYNKMKLWKTSGLLLAQNSKGKFMHFKSYPRTCINVYIWYEVLQWQRDCSNNEIVQTVNHLMTFNLRWYVLPLNRIE